MKLDLKKCESCVTETCTPKCFDAHPGSMIALKKAFKGRNIHIVEEK
jgi:hypothetical protein